MTDPREEPRGACPRPPPPSQGLDPALDRSMNGGGGSYWKFTVVDSRTLFVFPNFRWKYTSNVL